MELLWLIVLIPMLYFSVVALIAFLASVFAGRKGGRRETFRRVFIDFLWEFLNPLNWLG